MIEIQSVYGYVDVISPQFRVGVALARLIGETVPPHIHCDKPVTLGEIRGQLPIPGEPTLGKAMNEHDRATLRVARLDEVELCPSTTRDSMTLHHVLLS